MSARNVAVPLRHMRDAAKRAIDIAQRYQLPGLVRQLELALKTLGDRCGY